MGLRLKTQWDNLGSRLGKEADFLCRLASTRLHSPLQNIGMLPFSSSFSCLGSLGCKRFGLDAVLLYCVGTTWASFWWGLQASSHDKCKRWVFSQLSWYKSTITELVELQAKSASNPDQLRLNCSLTITLPIETVMISHIEHYLSY